jgi:hypothetical protein
MSETREQIETAANRIRTELLGTLKELDRRRQASLDWRHQLQAHRELVLTVVVGALVAVASGLSVAVFRRRRHRARLTRDRLRGLKRAWQHPRRLAAEKPRPALSAEVGRRMVVAFAGALGTQLAPRGAERLVPRDDPPELPERR